MKSIATAQCQCGDVTFEAEAMPLLQFTCHCTDCRDVSKTDFTTTAFFLADSSQNSGALSIRHFTAACGSQTTRESCSACGTFMFDKSERFPTLIGVVAKTINHPFKAEPSLHVWVKSKLDQVTIDDDLPQHEGDLS